VRKAARHNVRMTKQNNRGLNHLITHGNIEGIISQWKEKGHTRDRTKT